MENNENVVPDMLEKNEPVKKQRAKKAKAESPMLRAEEALKLSAKVDPIAVLLKGYDEQVRYAAKEGRTRAELYSFEYDVEEFPQLPFILATLGYLVYSETQRRKGQSLLRRLFSDKHEAWYISWK